MTARALGAGESPGAADQDGWETRDAAQSNHPPVFVKLSPIELATIFAPPGTVPAVIRHKGRLIAHHCPPDVAENLSSEGEG